MAIPVIAATATTNLSSASSFAIDLPAHSEGDLLLMVVQESAQRTWTTPSTWDSIGSRNAGSGGGSVAAFAKMAGASEGATKTISASGSTSILAYVCAITGAADFAVRPMVWGANGGDGTDIIAPSITATYDDSLIIINGHDSGGSGFAGTLSGGYTLIANLQQSTSFDDMVAFSRDSAAAADEVIAAKTILVQSSYAWAAFHLAIAPTAGGASAIPAFVHHRRLLGVQ